MNESARTGEHSQEGEALLRGPDDLLLDFDRGFRVFHELVGGCRVLHDIGPSVTVSGRRGSARTTVTTSSRGRPADCPPPSELGGHL